MQQGRLCRQNLTTLSFLLTSHAAPVYETADAKGQIRSVLDRYDALGCG